MRSGERRRDRGADKPALGVRKRARGTKLHVVTVHATQQEQASRWRLFAAAGPVTLGRVCRDALAGFTLAAMNVPQALGYTASRARRSHRALHAAAAARRVRGVRLVALPGRRGGLGDRRDPRGRLSPHGAGRERALRRARRAVALLTAGCLLLARLLPARLPRRLPLADRAGRLPHRRRRPGRHRRARRDARPADRRTRTPRRSSRRSRASCPAGPCADARESRRPSWRRARLPPLRAAAARPALAVAGRSPRAPRFDFAGARHRRRSGRCRAGCRTSALPDVARDECARSCPSRPRASS